MVLTHLNDITIISFLHYIVFLWYNINQWQISTARISNLTHSHFFFSILRKSRTSNIINTTILLWRWRDGEKVLFSMFIFLTVVLMAADFFVEDKMLTSAPQPKIGGTLRLALPSILNHFYFMVLLTHQPTALLWAHLCHLLLNIIQ